jgi:hypothetical protein
MHTGAFGEAKTLKIRRISNIRAIGKKGGER